MKHKLNPVDESNQLLQQLNAVLVTSNDLNGNAFSKPTESIPINNIPTENLIGDENYGKENAHPSNSNSRRESCGGNSEDFNDPAKVIGRVGEEHMRNVLFFLGFVAKFLQLVVASALLVLAIEWLPLHNYLEKQVDNMFISFLVLGLICAGLLLVKFKGRFLVVIIVNMLFMINFFWYMAASSFHYLVFSPYWIVLCAVTQTAACLFLGVLVYFQKATYKGCAIYGYAIIVPALFLILTQPYYFWWYLKLTGGQQGMGNVLEEGHAEISTTASDVGSTASATTLESMSNTSEEMIMSYSYYMINVCSGIGLAAVMTIEMVAWSQYSVKGLRFKTGTGILSGSFTALSDEDDTDGGNVPPVNL